MYPQSFRALNHRNFRIFMTGQFISVIGTWMHNVAQAWLIHKMTHSEFSLGLLAFLSSVPALIIGPFAGAFVDHHRRSKIVLCTQTCSMILAGTLAALCFTDSIQVWHIFTIGLAFGFVDSLDIPARHAFMAEMVHTDDLSNAIALNSTMFNGARLIGPAIAGILVASVGESWCFLLNAISYLAVLWGILNIKPISQNLTPSKTAMWERMKEGYDFARHHSTIGPLLLLLGLFCLSIVPYAVFMPVFADNILQGGPKALGLLLSCAGVGSLAAALVLARRENTEGLQRQISWGAVGVGVLLIAFSQSRSFLLSALLLVPVGFFIMLIFTGINTLIQSVAPDPMRGRMMSFYTMMFMGLPPIGSLLAGSVAEWIGAPWTVSLGAVVCCLVGALFLQRSKTKPS